MHMTSSAGTTSFDVWMVDGFYISEYVAKDTLVPISEFTANTGLTPDWFNYQDIIPAYRQVHCFCKWCSLCGSHCRRVRFIAQKRPL